MFGLEAGGHGKLNIIHRPGGWAGSGPASIRHYLSCMYLKTARSFGATMVSTRFAMPQFKT